MMLVYMHYTLKSHEHGRTDGPQLGVVLQEILLQLGEDVFAVGVLLQRGDVGPTINKGY